MKKLFNILKGKVSLISIMNLCAMAIAISTINVTCYYFHHQPKVPEEAKSFRKF